MAKGRLKRLVIIIIVSTATGMLTGMTSPVFLAIALTLTAIALATGLWNTTPVGFRPSPAYTTPPSDRLRWPEAAPIEPSGKNRRLILCVHGFPSTPADFRKLIDVSDARGWDIAAPLLPGCGTDPRDLLPTEWSQYLAMVRDWWIRLRPKYDSACIVGISMGGALTLALSEEMCGIKELEPAAISTIGAPAVLNSWYRHGLVKDPLLYLARFLAPIVPSMNARPYEPEPDAEDGGGSWKGYEGTFTRQAYTLQVGMGDTERNLSRVTCPILVCHGRGDRIVDFRNSGIIMAGVGSGDIEAYIANMDEFDHNRHNILLYDSQRDRLWNHILDFFEKRVP